MAIIPPVDRFLGLLSAACNIVATPSHSHDIGGGKIKVAAPGGSESVISVARGYQSNEEADFLPSQADDGIGFPNPTCHRSRRRTTFLFA